MNKAVKTPEEIAADRLGEQLVNYLNGCTGEQVAVAAFATANRTEGTVNGLIRLLCHKGILSRSDLGDSVAWSLNERADVLKAQNEKSGSSILAPSTSVRGN